MSRSESPSTALRARSPPLGEKDGMRGRGSWKGNTSKELDVNRSHEPGIPLTRPSTTLSPIGGEGWGEGVRFMGSGHLQNSDVSWGHEPGIPLTRPSTTLSPIGGEGWGEGVRAMGTDHLRNAHLRWC